MIMHHGKIDREFLSEMLAMSGYNKLADHALTEVDQAILRGYARLVASNAARKNRYLILNIIEKRGFNQ